MDHDPTRVNAQLDRLNQLAVGALEEMHTLISELRPDHVAGMGLVAEFQKEVERRRITDGLSVSVQIDGDQTLSVQEDQALFHILQEALNNIIKHAQATQAYFQIHLDDPMWIEAKDNGIGFSMIDMSGSSGLGIPGMHERANEINWDIKIQSAPGEGTRIYLEKNYL
jgi:signal transduction histidine kinase